MEQETETKKRIAKYLEDVGVSDINLEEQIIDVQEAARGERSYIFGQNLILYNGIKSIVLNKATLLSVFVFSSQLSAVDIVIVNRCQSPVLKEIVIVL